MIHCLYYGFYARYDATVDTEEWESAQQLHAVIYALGDKYDITILKDRAEWEFKIRPIRQPEDLLKWLKSIPIVYESTPDSDRRLRDVVIIKVTANPKDLLHKKVESAFRKVSVEVPDFDMDLHRQWIGLS